MLLDSNVRNTTETKLSNAHTSIMTGKQQPVVMHNTSRTRQAARRVGIVIESPQPHLPITEQEETDTM